MQTQNRQGKGSTHELPALCRKVKFETQQIETMLILYESVFLPRLIYSCESWSNLRTKDYSLHNFHILEVLWKFLVRHLLLHCSWSSQFYYFTKFEIEQRQPFFLKCILNKDPEDLVHAVYKEQLN